MYVRTYFCVNFYWLAIINISFFFRGRRPPRMIYRSLGINMVYFSWVLIIKKIRRVLSTINFIVLPKWIIFSHTPAAEHAVDNGWGMIIC